MLADEPTFEAETRIQEVAVWLAKGLPRVSCVRAASEEFEVGERQAREYVRHAEQRLRRISSGKEARELIGIHVARREVMALAAWHNGDLALALKIFDSQARLQGLFDIKDAAGGLIHLDQLAYEIEQERQGSGSDEDDENED